MIQQELIAHFFISEQKQISGFKRRKSVIERACQHLCLIGRVLVVIFIYYVQEMDPYVNTFFSIPLAVLAFKVPFGKVYAPYMLIIFDNIISCTSEVNLKKHIFF